jgi:hypothetical protein
MRMRPREGPPAWLPWALVFALAVVVAYLLGARNQALHPATAGPVAAPVSRSADVASAPAAASPAPVANGAEALPNQEPALPSASVPTSGASTAGFPPVDAPPATAPTRSAGSTAADQGLAASVAAYFGEVETIEREAKYWEDPQALAQALLKDISSGDSSGFDRLIETSRRARQRLQQMQVPEACQEHHHRTLSLMDDGLVMLENVRRSALAGDQAGLLAIQEQGKALENRAREVDSLAGDIKRRYGLGS